MINLLTLWGRGLLFTVAFVILATIVFGFIAFTIQFPHIGVPVAVLIILPLYFGWATEGDS